MAKCVIMGCTAHFLTEDKWLHGDLWEEEGCWVLNGVVGREGQAVFHYREPVWLAPTKNIIAIAGPYFERRGVVVVSKALATLNDAAKRYIHGDRGVRHA